MPIKVTCSNCGGVLHAPDDAGGRKGRCPNCGHQMPIPTDAPRVASTTSLPDPPKPAGRSQSFGEFGLGPHADAAAAGHAPAARGSAPIVAEKRRASVPLPPPTIDTPRRRAAFGPTGEAGEGTVRAWKRTRKGLWWVRAGVGFLLLPFLILNGVRLYENLAGPLPYKDPGYAGIPWLNSSLELELAAIAIPVLLGVPLLTLGRMGVSNAPKRSRASGLAAMAALATFAAVVGGVLLVMPAAAMMATDEPGKTPAFLLKVQNQPMQWQMFGMAGNESEGAMQHFGLLLGFLGLALGELWFLSAAGRLGTALDSPALAARATRLSILYGLFLVVAFVSVAGAFKVPPSGQPGNEFVNFTADITKFGEEKWKEFGQPQYDKLGANKPAARAGLNLFLTLVVGLGYFRMVGAGRGAIRGWLEANDRP